MQAAQFHLHAEIEDRHWWFVARRQILKTLIQRVVPPSQNLTIVDVGCGTGANLAALAGEYPCVGIDTSEDAVRLAKQRFPGIEFLHGFAPQDCAGALASASLVLLTDVLEHVSDDFALFSELLAATRPGTYFLITVPADESLWSPHDESFGHYRRYDPARLAAIWENMPVEPLLVSHYNSRLRGLVRAARQVNRLRGEATGAAGTDFRVPGPLANRLLTSVFSSERRQLLAALDQQSRGFSCGVSLIALLRRGGGAISPRSKPLSIPADLHAPALALLEPACMA